MVAIILVKSFAIYRTFPMRDDVGLTATLKNGVLVDKSPEIQAIPNVLCDKHDGDLEDLLNLQDPPAAPAICLRPFVPIHDARQVSSAIYSTFYLHPKTPHLHVHARSHPYLPNRGP